MITMIMRLSLSLFIILFLNKFILVNLIVDHLLQFDKIKLVIRYANNTRRIYYSRLATYFMDSMIKCIINIYSNVKKTVVVGSVSNEVTTRKNKCNTCDKILPSTSSFVLLLYTTLIAISQSTGKKDVFIFVFHLLTLNIVVLEFSATKCYKGSSFEFIVNILKLKCDECTIRTKILK